MSDKKQNGDVPMAEELSEAELDEVSGGLQYTLQNVMVTSWSTSGDADDRPTEEVAFYYNKVSTFRGRAG